MTRRTGTDPSLANQNLSGEILLIGAILRQTLSDARWDQPSQTPLSVHQQAIAFLYDQETLDWWAGLVGAEGDSMGCALRRAAGLE